MVCLECQQRLGGPTGGYADAAERAVLHHTGCCSARCAILKNLSLIFAHDKSALLPLLADIDKEPTKVMFRLEDVVTRLLQKTPPSPES